MGYVVLFPASETSFDNQGLGVLIDAISCEVTEELNGEFELEMEYPVTGVHFEEIGMRSILLCNTNPNENRQPFRVYQISEPLNGIVTIYARHISYDLSGYPVQPFATFTNLADAINGLVTNTNAVIEEPIPFTITYYGDNLPGNFAVDAPSSLRSWLGGRDGSILDVFGGEWTFDRFSCRLERQRGRNRGATIRYGKNLKSLDWDTNDEGQYTGVWGYYSYVFDKEKDQKDSEARCLGSYIKSVTEYYAAGTSKTTPPPTSEFLCEDDWKDTEDVEQPTVTKDLPYLWNYEEYEYQNGGTGSTSPQLVGHYGWTTVDDTEGQIDDFDVEYDEFGNSLVPYEHTAKTDPKEYYALSNSSVTEPPEKDDDGNDIWRTSVPSPTDNEPYLWNYTLTKRTAKKEMIIFSDVISVGTNDYKKILTVDLSDKFEKPPTKDQLNAFLQKYITDNRLGEPAYNISLDFSQLDEVMEPIYIGDTITVFFNDAEREIRVDRVVWDVLKDRYSSIEVGRSAYAGLGDAFSSYSKQNDSGGKYASSGLMAYFDNGYIKADVVDARLVKAKEGIFDQLRANYASINYLDANYASIDHLEANYANINTLVSTYATIENLNAQNAKIRNLEADTAKIHNLTAESLTATVGYIQDLTAQNITAQNISAATAAIGSLATDYATIDFANVNTANISDAWVKNLMVQSQFVAQEGTIFKLQLLELDANQITAGVMAAEHLQLKGPDGLYYQLNFDAFGQIQWDQLSPAEQAELQSHIHAKTILAHSITAEQLTVNNIVGTGGWINLANGTFAYQNATTRNGITWDGSLLSINADTLKIGSRTVEEVASENIGLNRMPSVYLYEDFYGKIFNDTDHGIIWTVNQDGSVTAKGTANGVARYIFTSCQLDDSVPAMLIDPEKKYTISGCPEGNTSSTVNFWLGGRLYDEETTPTNAAGTVFSETGEGYTTSTAGYRHVTIYAQIKDGYTTPQTGITFYPMFEVGETIHPYVSTHNGSGSMVDKMSLAEAKIEVNSNNIDLKVSKDGLIGEINASAGNVTINSQKIDLTGAVTFTDFATAAKNTTVIGVTTKNQYYLSNSDSAQTGDQWRDAMPNSISQSGKYLWTRVAVTKTFANDGTETTYSTPVLDINLNALKINVGSAVDTANSAIASTVSVYYRTSSNTQPAKPTASTAVYSRDYDNEWEYIMPSPKRASVGQYHYYTCEQYTFKDGTKDYSNVSSMPSLDYTAMWCSVNNSTKIDGASIFTGSITADQIHANAIEAKHIKAGAITADMITAGTMSADRIKGGTIDCNGAFTFQLRDGIGNTTMDIFKLSGTTDLDARIDINTAGFRYNGNNIHNAMRHMHNTTGNPTSSTVSGISDNIAKYYRFGNVIVVSFQFTASSALGSAQTIFTRLPAAYYEGSDYIPRMTFNSPAGGIGWGFVTNGGELRVRVTAGGTYYGGITYITSAS